MSGEERLEPTGVRRKRKFVRKPIVRRKFPPPPRVCPGFLYTVRPTDTLFLLARRFDTTVEAILRVNPQITDPNLISVGQVICIPDKRKPIPPHPGPFPKPPVHDKVIPVIEAIELLNEMGDPLPVIDGFVRLEPITIIRVRVSKPVTHVFFFFTPAGTESFLASRLIGVVAANEDTVVEFTWTVPRGLLGSVFVIACTGTVCRQSQEVQVISP